MSRLCSGCNAAVEPPNIPVYDRYDETKRRLSPLKTPEELERKLQKMMKNATGDNDLPVIVAYQLFAHKLDLRRLRVITQHKSILELLPYDIRERRSSDDTSEHLHILAARSGAIDVLRYLLEAGINVNNFYGAGHTMLHAACARGRIEVVEILLQHEANPSIPDADGKTPAQHAVERDKIAIIDRLYLAGVSFKDCHPKRHAVEAETVVRLFDLRVLQGEDLIRVLSLPTYIVSSYTRFFQVYNILYERGDGDENENGKKEAYRYLAETLEQLYSTGEEVRRNLKDLVSHFMAQYIGSEERDEELRQILLPYLHIQEAAGCRFNGTMQTLPDLGSKAINLIHNTVSSIDTSSEF